MVLFGDPLQDTVVLTISRLLACRWQNSRLRAENGFVQIHQFDPAGVVTNVTEATAAAFAAVINPAAVTAAAAALAVPTANALLPAV